MENIIEANPKLYKFGDLRNSLWIPKFKWVSSVSVAADIINSWHEDYPKYVESTELAINVLLGCKLTDVRNIFLNSIHATIFEDKSWSGNFRESNVIVGNHLPPRYENVPRLMENFEKAWLGNIKDIDSLTAWGHDALTIHCWQDGNGRCISSFVAAFSHLLEPDKGYLAALQ